MFYPQCACEVPDERKHCTRCGLNLTDYKNQMAEHTAREQAIAQEAGAFNGQAYSGQTDWSNRPESGSAVMPGAWATPQQKGKGGFMEAFSYPFRDSGPVILIMVVILLVVSNRFFAVVPIIGYIGTLFINGNLTLYYFSIINATSAGRANPTEWPDISGVWDLISACIMWFILNLIAVGPVVIYGIYARMHGALPNPFSLCALALWGIVYMPMALIMVAETRNIIPLFPIFVLRAIYHAPPKYYRVCFFTVVCFLPLLVTRIPNTLNITFAAGSALSAVCQFIYLYAMFVLSRVLGLMSKDFQDKGFM